MPGKYRTSHKASRCIPGYIGCMMGRVGKVGRIDSQAQDCGLSAGPAGRGEAGGGGGRGQGGWCVDRVELRNKNHSRIGGTGLAENCFVIGVLPLALLEAEAETRRALNSESNRDRRGRGQRAPSLPANQAHPASPIQQPPDPPPVSCSWPAQACMPCIQPRTIPRTTRLIFLSSSPHPSLLRDRHLVHYSLSSTTSTRHSLSPLPSAAPLHCSAFLPLCVAPPPLRTNASQSTRRPPARPSGATESPLPTDPCPYRVSSLLTSKT